jgi:hypothetical protein
MLKKQGCGSTISAFIYCGWYLDLAFSKDKAGHTCDVGGDLLAEKLDVL